jgi:hypothetical protein
VRVPDAKDTLWQRWFPWVLVSLWVLTPEARRLIDWQIGFNSLSILSLIPILSMLPLVGIFFGSKRITLPRDFAAIVVLWVGGFAYALLVAFLSGGLLGALYDATLFCVPVMVGLWLTTMDAGAARRVFDRFAWAALVAFCNSSRRRRGTLRGSIIRNWAVSASRFLLGCGYSQRSTRRASSRISWR